jgi:[acyl-carrier-protein] S-malonyltransferase
MWAALFPGQGSQSVGMGRFLFDNFASARHLFEEASDAVQVDFKKLCFEDPKSTLQLTENTQPALLLVSMATFNVVQETTPLQITAGAGHSIGEYAAIVASGALKFTDAIRAVRARGQAMQRAVPVGEGGMLAVMGLTEPQVVKLCHWVEQSSGFKPLEPANFNAPGQIVISGAQTAIDWAKINTASTATPKVTTPLADVFGPETPRLKLIPLTVSAPFHCSLMKPAEEEMRHVLSEISFSDAAWPIVQNVTALEAISGQTLRENLILQISGPVRWTQCMSRLKSLHTTRMIEFGSGKVLSGLAKKIDSEAQPPFNINSLDDLKALEAALR